MPIQEITIEDLQEEIKELKAKTKGLQSDLEEATTKNERLEKENTTLEKQAEELEENAFEGGPAEEALRRFADPANWQGNVWRPVEGHIEREYPDRIAADALGGIS